MVSIDIQILSEREVPGGLSFQARVGRDDEIQQTEVRLDWADYNLWSPDGADAPERVAMAVIRYLTLQAPAGELEIPRSFDAASLRRRYPDADRAITRLIRRGRNDEEVSFESL